MAAMDVISFGWVFLEFVFGPVPALPRPGQEILAEEFAISCGGAVTSATAAARTGVRAGLCTRLGDDIGGRVVAEHCEREGVDLSPSVRVPRPATGITMVLNYDGDRSFVTHLPSVPDDEPPERGRWLDVLRSSRPAWIYVHAGIGLTDFLTAARDQGTDRKSTRLNSSHQIISYAVFCLKKKKKLTTTQAHNIPHPERA